MHAGIKVRYVAKKPPKSRKGVKDEDSHLRGAKMPLMISWVNGCSSVRSCLQEAVTGDGIGHDGDGGGDGGGGDDELWQRF